MRESNFNPTAAPRELYPQCDWSGVSEQAGRLHEVLRGTASFSTRQFARLGSSLVLACTELPEEFRRFAEVGRRHADKELTMPQVASLWQEYSDLLDERGDEYTYKVRQLVQAAYAAMTYMYFCVRLAGGGSCRECRQVLRPAGGHYCPVQSKRACVQSRRAFMLKTIICCREVPAKDHKARLAIVKKAIADAASGEA